MKAETKIKILLESVKHDLELLSKSKIETIEDLVDIEIDAESLFENIIRLRVLCETFDKRVL